MKARTNFLFKIALCFIASNADAQLFVGITGDYGNKISYKPSSESLIERPGMPSVSVLICKQQKLKGQWYVQYGMGIGVLGYNLKVYLYDSLSNPNYYSPYVSFPSFSTFYVNGIGGIGSQFQLKHRYLDWYLSGGLSFYFGPEEAGRAGNSPNEILFEYQLEPSGAAPRGFLETSIQTNLSKKLVLGLRYQYHFTPAIEGTYHFNQAESSGELFLIQRAFSVMVMLRISSADE